jgi:hypothetical protein
MLMVGLFLLLNAMLKDSMLVESYASGEVIYPSISLGIKPPVDLIIPITDHYPLTRVVLFIAGNPIYFLKLYFVKLFLFLGNMKPYYSPIHNVMIALVLYPLYGMAIRGYKIMDRHQGKYFIAAYVVTQSFSVAMTSENWDGRFLIPLLPFIFILSAIGIGKMLVWSKITIIQ